MYGLYEHEKGIIQCGATHMEAKITSYLINLFIQDEIDENKRGDWIWNRGCLNGEIMDLLRFADDILTNSKNDLRAVLSAMDTVMRNVITW